MNIQPPHSHAYAHELFTRRTNADHVPTERTRRDGVTLGLYGRGTKFDSSGFGQATVTLSDCIEARARAPRSWIRGRSHVERQPFKWTRIDLLAVKGNACNYHALIIPPS
jgi:hypothetical protein